MFSLKKKKSMKKTRVAVNGAGRIGRAFIKVASKREEIEIVGINDLGDAENIAYLLNYDTVYGRSGLGAKVFDAEHLEIGGKKVRFTQEKDPSALPWKELDVDVVVESTGVFEEYSKAKLHLDAGAKRVVISAPAKGEPIPEAPGATILMGVNDEDLATCKISSNASCTTNSEGAIMKVLTETVGVEKALLNTVHAYTATQSLVDGPAKKDLRRGRAAAQNIIPSTTGAAKATSLAVKALENKFDGIALRVPVPAGSVADVTFIASRDTTVEEINDILTKASQEDRYKKIFSVTNEEIVSSDIVGSEYAGIVDLSMTRVVGGNLVKILAWYDNEMGYTHMLVEHVIKTAQHIK